MSSTPGKDISYADARAIHAVVAEDAATPRLASHIKVPRFSTVAPRPGSQAPRFATTPPRAPIPTITPDPDPEEEEEESFDDEEDAAKGMWLSNESSGRPKNPLLEQLYKNQVSCTVSQSPRPRGFMSTNRSPRGKNTGQQHHYNIQKIGVGASRTYSDKRMQHQKAQEAAAKNKGAKGAIRRKKTSSSTAAAPSAATQAAPTNKPTLRRRRTAGAKTSEEADSKRQSTPILGPVEGSRAQSIGNNGMLSVTALEFAVSPLNPNRLGIEINIHNDTSSPISSITIELHEDDSIKASDSIPPTSEIPAKGDIQIQLELEITEIIKPHIAKLRFIPTSAGADTLESSIKIFPSYFLVPEDESSLAEAEEESSLESTLDFSNSAIKPKELLQTIVNVTRGTIISTDDIHIRKILSKTTEGQPLVSILKADKESTQLIIKSSEDPLLQAITREIKMKTQK